MLNLLDKWFSKKWFNFGYMFILSIITLVFKGGIEYAGWALLMVYFIICAFIDVKKKAVRSVEETKLELTSADLTKLMDIVKSSDSTDDLKAKLSAEFTK